MSNMKTLSFLDLPLGAKFQYINDQTSPVLGRAEGPRTWIKISNERYGIIAEYVPEFMTSHWIGQSICCFAESREKMNQRVWALG